MKKGNNAYGKRVAALAAALVMLVSLLAGMGTNVAAAAPEDVIDIFTFNDFHGTVDKSASMSNPGADRFVAIVKELQKENPNNMILAAGDSYQGSSVSNLFEGEPVSEMMKQLGVHYSAVGNHEYDWGADKFAKYMEDGAIEFLAANIFLKGTQNRPDYVKPYAIQEISGKKIGIIGLTTAEIPTLVKAEHVAGLDIVDPSTEEAGVWLGSMIDDLRNNRGCDAVIALTHLGTWQSGDIIAGEGADLANSVHGAKFDAIITGHSHKAVSGFVNGVAVVQGNYNGRGLGRLTLYFTGDELVVTPMAYSQNDMNSANILPVDVVDETMKAIIEEYNRILGPMLAKVVGVYGQDISNRDDQARWANQLVYDYIKRETGADYVLVQNAGSWRDTSPYDWKAADEVTMSYMYSLMPFDNEIVLMDLSGNRLLEILAAVEDTIYPYTTGGIFTSPPVVTGATKTDLGWCLADGATKIEAGGTYKVACNDFMLTGGDRYTQFADGIYIRYMGVPLRDAMVEVLSGRIVPEGLSVTPSHTVMTAVGDTVEFEALLNGLAAVEAQWTASPTDVVSFAPGGTGQKVVARLESTEADIIKVTASYEGYTATATIEILHDGLDVDITADPPAGVAYPGDVVTLTCASGVDGASFFYTFEAGAGAAWLAVPPDAKVTLPEALPATLRVRAEAEGYVPSREVTFEYGMGGERLSGAVSAFPLNGSVVAGQKVRLVYAGPEFGGTTIKYTLNGGEKRVYDNDSRIVMDAEALAGGGRITAWAEWTDPEGAADIMTTLPRPSLTPKMMRRATWRCTSIRPRISTAR